jgi:hypothetical protein
MTASPSSSSSPRIGGWTPRIWEGSHLFAWLRLLVRNRFAIHPRFGYVAVVVTFVSLIHLALRYLQEAWYGDRLDRTVIRHSPLFIIGHWRTGTTLLHELLILDDRHAFPTTYECLEPNHFLLTEGLVRRCLWFLLPSRRPMDNVPMGWDRPQEDEFALCMMGQPSPYLTIAFPNHPPQDQEALDLDRLPPRARKAWKDAFLRFLRRLTFRHGQRRLILKSPTHTCRIPALLEMFPDAYFVHIVRDPRAVFPSTVNLWKALYRRHGLQWPTYDGLEEHVFNTFTHFYERLEQTKHLIPPGHFHEMRYEELIADPLGQMQRLYDALGLGGFDAARPRMQDYLRANAGYQTNRYPELNSEALAEVRRRWGAVIERYGYDRGSETT